jgi:hypothetical protein
MKGPLKRALLLLANYGHLKIEKLCLQIWVNTKQIGYS